MYSLLKRWPQLCAEDLAFAGRIIGTADKPAYWGGSYFTYGRLRRSWLERDRTMDWTVVRSTFRGQLRFGVLCGPYGPYPTTLGGHFGE